ncbi:MAG TPA: hypothetical protein VNM22_22270 [Candidatus Limnocylindrales bacterium]|nr:hypothetical protein [Candidatus Limnocylindrales bacterium]
MIKKLLVIILILGLCEGFSVQTIPAAEETGMQAPGSPGLEKPQSSQPSEEAGKKPSGKKAGTGKQTVSATEKSGGPGSKGKEKTSSAQAATSPCNRPGFVPNPSFQSRTVWATYLALTNGRVLPIQRYIVNECVIVAVFRNGSARILDYSQVDLSRSAQYTTTEEEARRISGTLVTSQAPGESTTLGVGYYDLGRSVTTPTGSTPAQGPGTSQGGTPGTPAPGTTAGAAPGTPAGTTTGPAPAPGMGSPAAPSR